MVVMDVEATRVLAVLEDAVDALELVASLPSSTEPSVCEEDARIEDHRGRLVQHLRLERAIVTKERRVRHDATTHEPHERDSEDEDSEEETMAAYSTSLHEILRTLTHDKSTRNALRQSASVSSDLAHFVHAWTELIITLEQRLTTTAEQDDVVRDALRDASVRLHELANDRRQVEVELQLEREARAASSLTWTKRIATLRDQLLDMERTTSDALSATLRQRDADAHALRSQYDQRRTTLGESRIALERQDTRVTEAHEQTEVDVRRRTIKAGHELRELLRRYDDEMMALDATLEQERQALGHGERELARLETYFARVDDDKRVQLDELRQMDLMDRLRRHRDRDVFRFVQRLQAVVRGFLARRALGRPIVTRTKKTKKKTKKTTKKKTKMTDTKKPTRPTSAARTKSGDSFRRPQPHQQ